MPKRTRFGIKEARRLAELLDGIRAQLAPQNRWRIEADSINDDFISGVLSTPTARKLALDRLEFIWSEIQTAREIQIAMTLTDDPDSLQNGATDASQEPRKP